MSNDVKRYSYGFHDDGFGMGRTLGLVEKTDGNLVPYDDYAALEAVLGRVREEHDKAWDKAGTILEKLSKANAELDEARADLQALKAQMAGQEPVVYAINVRGKGMRTTVYTEVLPFHPDTGIEQICEPVPLYAAPPAAQYVSGLVDALHSMTCAYRSAIQAGYDRITALGGDCDSVQLMLNNYPDYRKAVALIAAHRQAQQQEGDS